MSSPVSLLSFDPLDSGLRRSLESSVVEARGVVEDGVARVFSRLGVEPLGVSDRLPEHLSDDERLLRRVVLAKRRQVGSVDAAIEEVAFGVWHRMLFARFLAENNLLIHPVLEVGVSLEECVELAVEEGVDGWTLASRFAAQMLPGLFPQDDPLARIGLLPEDLHALEGLLEGLPREVFTSDDGLGWVYQFWQSRRKDEINKAEMKIGARELPAVTQLFTEHYMVRFLLENSLGAWWAARHPDSPLVDAFDYLRFTDDGHPAAGSFEGWPDTVAGVTVMDPCCGSGHFVTAAFEMLWRMRAEEEHLTPTEAQDATIRDNLFGLELDPRCTQIAAFNLALTAWKAGGYRQLPLPNIACSGIRVAGSLDEWLKLAGDDERLRAGLAGLHAQFKDADTLGSLINLRRASQDGTLTSVDFDELEPLLHQALTLETTTDPAAALFGHQAEAVTHAATLLSRQYTLVTTNPPFLGRGLQSEVLREHLSTRFPDAKDDVATAFLASALVTVEDDGTIAIVTPQNWLFLRRFEGLRESLLRRNRWHFVAQLGEGAFASSQAAGALTALVCISRDRSGAGAYFFMNAVGERNPAEKDEHLVTGDLESFDQISVLASAHKSVSVQRSDVPPLGALADSWEGLVTADASQYIVRFWEVEQPGQVWERYITAPVASADYSGRSSYLRWERGRGRLVSSRTAHNFNPESVLGRQGVVVAPMRKLRVSLYRGEMFNQAAVPIVTKDPSLTAALWAFSIGGSLEHEPRRINQKLKIDSGYFLDVPFDADRWRKVAEEEFPEGLPEPWSDDPTQWLFLGDPAVSTEPLQVAVARLLGYSWPDQQPDHLDALADSDGIVCLPPVHGERPAADRLRELLISAFSPDDPTGLIDGLLKETEAGDRSLDWWLRERFFVQHCKLFHHRPFVWHVWDGRRDGFSALVNYHRLDNSNLRKLTYTYLGWWIDRQKGQVREEKPGAEARLAAALDLQKRLELVLEGEPPYDIFVRWKELWEQPVGWEPDLNDGVRLNVRPFVEAGILRSKFNVKWDKDRGKNPDGSERHNRPPYPYTRAVKVAARQEHEDESA